MNLETALTRNLIRPVPIDSKTGFMESYKGKDVIDFHDLLNTEIVLVNAYGKFMYIKNKAISGQTITSMSGVAIVYIDTPLSVANAIKRVNKSSFIKVKLDEKTLQTELANLSEVDKLLSPTTFASLAVRIINKDTLSDTELISILVDSRFLNVFDYADITNFTHDGVIFDIASQRTLRAKLYVQELRDGVEEPESLALFTQEEVKVLKKAVPLL